MNNMLPSYLTMAAILFCIGLYGALVKRNAVVVLLSLELMLNAVNLNLVAFSKYGVSSVADRANILVIHDYGCRG